MIRKGKVKEKAQKLKNIEGKQMTEEKYHREWEREIESNLCKCDIIKCIHVFEIYDDSVILVVSIWEGKILYEKYNY